MEIAPENTESTGIAYRIALQLPVINRAAFCPLPSVKVRCCPLNPLAPCGTPTVRQLSRMSDRKARRRVRAKRRAPRNQASSPIFCTAKISAKKRKLLQNRRFRKMLRGGCRRARRLNEANRRSAAGGRAEEIQRGRRKPSI